MDLHNTSICYHKGKDSHLVARVTFAARSADPAKFSLLKKVIFIKLLYFIATHISQPNIYYYVPSAHLFHFGPVFLQHPVRQRKKELY